MGKVVDKSVDGRLEGLPINELMRLQRNKTVTKLGDKNGNNYGSPICPPLSDWCRLVSDPGAAMELGDRTTHRSMQRNAI